KLRQHALRLSEGVAEEDRGDAPFPVGAPPPEDLLDHLCRGRPPVDGQSESRLADKALASNDLERRAGRIGLAFVVPRDHPDAALVLDADLSGAQDMACRVKRYGRGSERRWDPVVHGGQGCVLAQALARDAKSRTCENVARAARAQMVPMGMRYDCGFYGLPGVDVEVTRAAVESLLRDGNERFGIRAHEQQRSGRRVGGAAARVPAAVRRCRTDDQAGLVRLQPGNRRHELDATARERWRRGGARG